MTDTLYAGKGQTDTTSDLYTINPATGAATSIGASGFALTGLAFEHDGTTLWGASSANSAAHPRSLISINAATGAGTFVGAFGTTISDITTDAADVLYGWAPNSGSGSLATINKTTGAATIVGDSGLGGVGGAIAFSSGGTLYLVTRKFAVATLYTVDPATGAVTLVGASSDSHVYNAMTFSSGGVLYAFDGASHLVTINTSTAAFVLGAGVSGAWDALAWPPPVPHPFSMIKFGNGLQVTDEGGGVIRVDVVIV